MLGIFKHAVCSSLRLRHGALRATATLARKNQRRHRGEASGCDIVKKACGVMAASSAAATAQAWRGGEKARGMATKSGVCRVALKTARSRGLYHACA